MNIKLVKNGIFPIIKDKDGNMLESIPDTGFPVAGTVQGEGKLLGTSCLFIRLSGCNLRCSWQLLDGSIDICDTPYSSHHADSFDWWSIDDIIGTVSMNIGSMKHIVITGGEPTQQPIALAILVEKLKKALPKVHLTLESNGTTYLHDVAKYIDLFSFSPKLSPSKPTLEKISKMKKPIESKYVEQHHSQRISIEALQRYINSCYTTTDYYGSNPRAQVEQIKDIQLKFVVTKDSDEDEIKGLVSKLTGLLGEDIIIMPVGSSKSVLSETLMMGVNMAIRNGWRFTPRTHIDLFGDKAGV